VLVPMSINELYANLRESDWQHVGQGGLCSVRPLDMVDMADNILALTTHNLSQVVLLLIV